MAIRLCVPALLFLALISLSFSGCASPLQVADCKDCTYSPRLLFTQPTELTFRFDVTAVVNGKVKRFKLDTGSYKSSVASDEQTKALPSLKKIQAYGAAAVPMDCDEVVLDTFQAAGIGRRGLHVERCSSESLLQNILGLDMLAGQVLELNFTNATFRVVSHPPDGMPMTSMKRGPFGHMELPVRVGHEEGLAVFDTGCEMTAVDNAYVALHPEIFHPFTVEIDGKAKTVEAPATDATGKTVAGTLYVVDDLRVGSLHLKKQLVAAIPFPEKLKENTSSIMIVGSNSMVYADWIFDLKNNVWGFSKRKVQK
jgi:hypothetical protein